MELKKPEWSRTVVKIEELENMMISIYMIKLKEPPLKENNS